MLRMAMALPFFILMAWWAGRTRKGVTPEALQWRDRLGIVPFIGCAANPFSIPMPISVDRLAAPGCGAAPC